MIDGNGPARANPSDNGWSRRAFLARSSAALAGAALAMPATARLLAFPLDGVMGLQSYDVRQALAADPAATLKTLSGYGYRALDLVVNAQGGTAWAQQYRQALDGAAMICHNGHFNAAMFEAAAWAETLEVARTLGVKEMVCAGGVRATSADDWKRYADLLNTYGAQTRKEGLQLGWHNHGEFKPVDGQVPYDLLLKNTDPAAVKFQIDVGNMAQAGGDPVAYLTTYPTRFYSMHLKDVRDGKIGLALGEGTLDFKKIVGLAKAANIHNYDVETGAPEAMVMEKLRISADYLKTFTL